MDYKVKSNFRRCSESLLWKKNKAMYNPRNKTKPSAFTDRTSVKAFLWFKASITKPSLLAFDLLSFGVYTL